MRSRQGTWATSAAAVGVGLGLLVLGVPLLALGLPHQGATLRAGVSTGSRTATPPTVMAAYRAADGWCPGLRWQLLAGIGEEESGNATTDGARVDPRTGEVTPTIFGPPLDGSNGTQRIPIGPWLGWSGLPGPWQQAVGPMQFLPATFTAWAVDVTGSGADANNIYDAADTAANYLCQGHNGAITDERAAILRYNDNESYASAVLGYADSLPQS